MAQWDADIDFTQQQAAQLIERQFPELSPARLERLGTGWDNTAYVVNGRWVFRFPRRRAMAKLLENEVRVLPRLSPHLPLPISVPNWIGRPEESFPYVFAGYALLPGRTACAVAWTPYARAQNAEPLGRFLSALHGLAVSEADEMAVTGDALERTSMSRLAPRILEWLAEVEPHEPEVDYAAVRAWMSRLLDTPPWGRRPSWVHGDIYARHLLVDEQHRLTGVIDWGEVHLGDPAVDLGIAFSFLPPEARKIFCAAYGEIDEATWARARFRGLFYGAVLLHYGRGVGDEEIAQVGRDALSLTILD